jgi:hypothetical protein
MVKVLKLKVDGIENGKRLVVVDLVADTKDEVITCGTSGAKVVGLTADDTMVLGSMALCADGNFGMIDSAGEWKF